MERPNEVTAPEHRNPSQASDASNETASNARNDSRREFLCRSARKLAYAAPLVMLFHPRPACASNGSTLTYWDEGEGTTKTRGYDEI